MEEKVTLSSLFNSHKDELEQQLRGLILPQNAEQIQMTISRLFDRLFDRDGDFRQSLTQSEDFVLQASLKMLNSQQSITNGLISLALAMGITIGMAMTGISILKPEKAASCPTIFAAMVII